MMMTMEDVHHFHRLYICSVCSTFPLFLPEHTSSTLEQVLYSYFAAVYLFEICGRKDKQTNRQTDRQTNKQTERHADTLIAILGTPTDGYR